MKNTKKQPKNPELWVSKDEQWPTIIYPDMTVEYWAGNDPNPRWCSYRFDWEAILRLRKYKKESFVAELK